MIVIRDEDAVSDAARGSVLAIGNFDGVHRGHKELLARTVAVAKEAGRSAGVIVFEPHPSQFFHPEEPHFRLTPLEEKLRLLESLGIDVVVVLGFNANLVRLSAEEFVAQVLVERLGISHAVIGYDFYFGRGRTGTPETLKDEGVARGFGVTIVKQQAEEGQVFSSTAIRLHLAQGDIAGAARLLGHWWRVSGVVIDGNKVGTGLGFPTANIELPDGASLMHGIYAVRVFVRDEVYTGAAYYGARPTVDDGPERLEVFILDFSGDLYGHTIGVEFIAYLRGDKRFDGLEALKAQIAIDCEEARAIVDDVGATPLD